MVEHHFLSPNFRGFLAAKFPFTKQKERAKSRVPMYHDHLFSVLYYFEVHQAVGNQPVRFDRLPVKPVRPGSGLVRYETGPNSKFYF